MMQVLLAIFRHPELSKLLAFKGGTSLMLFHGLTRFSTDLDFILLNASQTEYVYKELRKVLLKFSTIDTLVNSIGLPRQDLCLHCFDGSSAFTLEEENK